MNKLDNTISKFSHLEIPESILDIKEDYLFFEESLSEKQDELGVSEDEEEKEKIQSDIDAIQKAQEKLLAKAEAKLTQLDEEFQKNKPEPKPTPTPEPTPHVAPKDEKKSNGVGWAIFGAIALVVTLGAVNVMKK
jgi:DNA-binding protein H-NS